jgi:hypothetical protein
MRTRKLEDEEAMIDNAHIPPRLEGEQGVKSDSSWRKPPDTGINKIDQVSLEAVIQILIKHGICTEAELFAEENRLRPSETIHESTPFAPVQIHSERHRHADGNRLRRWAAKRHWTRRLGTILFGWKWHRKKNDPHS